MVVVSHPYRVSPRFETGGVQLRAVSLAVMRLVSRPVMTQDCCALSDYPVVSPVSYRGLV